MANQGWTNGAGDGTHTSSTDRQSGRGTTVSPAVPGSKVAHPSGGDNDPMGDVDDLFEVPGNLSTSGG